MKKKLIMVIAGSQWQIPIVKKIKQMGYKSLVVNLYEDSPAFKYADFHEVADILDKEKCLNIAKQYHIDAVLSEECDIATPTVAYIAARLGLPSLSEEMAQLYTDKSQMREFCYKYNLPSPRFKKCRTEAEAKTFIGDTFRKVIIKPLDSNSSRGVHVIHGFDELHDKFNDSLSYSHVEKAVLIEDYIEGTEFTVDGIVTPEGHKCLAISEKRHYEFNPSIANELFFTQDNENYDYELLRKTNDRFVDLSGLRTGTLTHAEYKYQDGQFWLIEIGARGGGNLISAEIVPLVSGIDNYEFLVRSALGDDNWKLGDLHPESSAAVLRFLDSDFSDGYVKEIQGEDILKDDSDIITYRFNFTVGDHIKKAENDSARIGFYIAKSDSRGNLRRKIDFINNSIKIIPNE